MSFITERRHLLPPSSQQSTDYDTFNPPANSNGNASTDEFEGQSFRLERQEQNHIIQISNEAEEDREPATVRQGTIAFSCLRSNKPLKYLVIAFGLWSEAPRWIIYLIIPIVILELPVEIYLASNTECKIDFSFNGGGGGGGYSGTDLDHWVTRFVELLSYSIMCYCVWQLRKHRQSIRLPQAFNLAKTTFWLNLILFLSICLIIPSIVLRNYIPQEGSDHVIYGVENQKIYLAWRLVSSVVTWQPVICCLLFDVIMKALSTLIDQCLERILTMRAEFVNDYIQVHQDLCCKVEATFLAFKKWLIFNIVAFILLLFWNGIRKAISLFGNDDTENPSDDFLRFLCYSPGHNIFSFVFIQDYYLCVLFLYIIFNIYLPWSSVYCLRKSFNHLVQKLNDKTDWDRQHLFHDRFNLNCFLQYANIAERRPFMSFIFRSMIPYLSLLLAIFGISSALYHYQVQNEYNQP